MKNTFKKVAASVMAVASLASVMVGMSASAAEGTGYVTTSGGSTLGKSACSVTNTFVWVKTESTVGTVEEISAKITSWDGTISGTKSLTYADEDYVDFSRSATGTYHASSSHSIKTYNGSTGSSSLSVSR